MTTQQGDQIIYLLTAIVERLDAFAETMPDGDEDEGCPHPEDKRVSLATPDDRNHWVCALCRFDNKAATTAMS